MLNVLKNLAVNYALSATPFFIAHLLLLAYFFRRWVRSRGLINKDLDELRGSKEVPELLSGAQEQILKYAGQGREPDLPRLEMAATDKIYRHLELGRLLINSFVVVGLMGTLFALFDVGQDAGTLKGPQDVLSRMSVAFSASFFGLLWALACNLFFLRYLRRLATQAAQEVGRRLSEFSSANPPESPARALGQAAQSLEQNAAAVSQAIARLERREKVGLRASHQILNDFRDTTKTVIADLADEVKEAQRKSATTVGDLKTGITSSLNAINNRFVEISTSWRADINKTIKASEGAAERLGKASESLASATAEVSTSLRAVQQSLERTKVLAEIVTGVEALTKAYLKRTGEQLDLFGKGLNETLDAARSIPDEWFTMLGKRNSELTEGLTEVIAVWEGHVTGTAEELATRFEKVGGDIASLHELLSPEGRLAETIGRIQETVRLTTEWVDYKSRADINVQLDALLSAVEKLDSTVGHLPSRADGGVGAASFSWPDGLHELPPLVADIKKLLGELVGRNGLKTNDEAGEPPTPQTYARGESDGPGYRTLGNIDNGAQASAPNQVDGIVAISSSESHGEVTIGDAQAAYTTEERTSHEPQETFAVTMEDSAPVLFQEETISDLENLSDPQLGEMDAVSTTKIAGTSHSLAEAQESAAIASFEAIAAPASVITVGEAEVGNTAQEAVAPGAEEVVYSNSAPPFGGGGLAGWLKRKFRRDKGAAASEVRRD